MCQPAAASPDGTFSKQSLANYLFLISTFLHFSPDELVVFFKYTIEKYFGNKF